MSFELPSELRGNRPDFKTYLERALHDDELSIQELDTIAEFLDYEREYTAETQRKLATMLDEISDPNSADRRLGRAFQRVIGSSETDGIIGGVRRLRSNTLRDFWAYYDRRRAEEAARSRVQAHRVPQDTEARRFSLETARPIDIPPPPFREQRIDPRQKPRRYRADETGDIISPLAYDPPDFALYLDVILDRGLSMRELHEIARFFGYERQYTPEIRSRISTLLRAKNRNVARRFQQAIRTPETRDVLWSVDGIYWAKTHAAFWRYFDLRRREDHARHEREYTPSPRSSHPIERTVPAYIRGLPTPTRKPDRPEMPTFRQAQPSRPSVDAHDLSRPPFAGMLPGTPEMREETRRERERLRDTARKYPNARYYNEPLRGQYPHADTDSLRDAMTGVRLSEIVEMMLDTESLPDAMTRLWYRPIDPENFYYYPSPEALDIRRALAEIYAYLVENRGRQYLDDQAAQNRADWNVRLWLTGEPDPTLIDRATNDPDYIRDMERGMQRLVDGLGYDEGKQYGLVEYEGIALGDIHEIGYLVNTFLGEPSWRDDFQASTVLQYPGITMLMPKYEQKTTGLGIIAHKNYGQSHRHRQYTVFTFDARTGEFKFLRGKWVRWALAMTVTIRSTDDFRELLRSLHLHGMPSEFSWDTAKDPRTYIS